MTVVLTAEKDIEVYRHAQAVEGVLDSALEAYAKLAEENAELHRQLKRAREWEEPAVRRHRGDHNGAADGAHGTPRRRRGIPDGNDRRQADLRMPRLPSGRHITAPICQGTNSLSP